MTGPVVLRVAGDSYGPPSRIAMILWEGATTAGDRIELHDRRDNTLLVALRTPDTQTLIGFSGPQKGINAPYGFTLALAPSVAQNIQVFLMEL